MYRQFFDSESLSVADEAYVTPFSTAMHTKADDPNGSRSLCPTLSSSIYRQVDDSIGIIQTTVSPKLTASFMTFDTIGQDENEAVVWPGLRRPSPKHPSCLTPHQHQVFAATSLLQAIWANDTTSTNILPDHQIPRYNGPLHGVVQMLSDFVGAGKTVQAIMFITGLAFAHGILANKRRTLNPTTFVLPSFMLRDRSALKAEVDTNDAVERESEEPGLFPLPEAVQTGWESRFGGSDSCSKAAPPNAPTLVLVRKSIMEQWCREISRTVDPACLQLVRYGTKAEMDKAHQLVVRCQGRINERPILLIAEATVVRDQWVRLESAARNATPDAYAAEKEQTLFSMNFTSIVILEAHRYRNLSTKESQAISWLCRLSCTRLLLTATPVVNSPIDIANIFKAARHPLTSSSSGYQFFDWLAKVNNDLQHARQCERQYSAMKSHERTDANVFRGNPESAHVALDKNVPIYQAIGIDAEWGAKRLQLAITQAKLAEDAAWIGIWNRFGGSIVCRTARSRSFPRLCFDLTGRLRTTVTISDTEPLIPGLPRESCEIVKCVPGPWEKTIAKETIAARCPNEETAVTTSKIQRELENAIANYQGQTTDTHDKIIDSLRSRYLAKACRLNDRFLTINRQVTVAPFTTMTKGLFPEDPNDFLLESAKLERTIELCKRILAEDRHLPLKDRRKVVIYCCWPSHFPYIAYCFAKAGLSFASLTGDMSKQKRQSLIDAIQSDLDHPVECNPDDFPPDMQYLSKSRITLISEVGCEGVKLTRASVIIALDGNWCPSGLEQMKGRFVRQGQRAEVVQFFFMQSPERSDQRLSIIRDQKQRVGMGLTDVLKELMSSGYDISSSDHGGDEPQERASGKKAEVIQAPLTESYGPVTPKKVMTDAVPQDTPLVAMPVDLDKCR